MKNYSIATKERSSEAGRSQETIMYGSLVWNERWRSREKNKTNKTKQSEHGGGFAPLGKYPPGTCE